jgi:hypothetical protein
MAEKSSKRLHIAPLQELTLVPITDPAEWAALERKIRESQKGAGAKKATPARVKALYRQLPAAARRELLARLAAELSADEQRELVKQLRASVRPKGAPRAQESRRRRNGQP